MKKLPMFVLFTVSILSGILTITSSSDGLEIRGEITNLSSETFTWDTKNFAGFYYDINKDLGNEKITFRLTNISAQRENATLSDIADAYGNRGIVYSSAAQPKNFRFQPWGGYEVIGFLGKRYFAAYSEAQTQAMQYLGENAPFLYLKSNSTNLMASEQLSEVLIDDNLMKTIATGTPLSLMEGYKLKILSVDPDEVNVTLELTKDGKSLDSKVVQPSKFNATLADKTYYYCQDLGDAKDIVTIAVHFKNAFHSPEVQMATIDGIFQISDTSASINVGKQFDRMIIKEVDPDTKTITMDNKNNPLILTKGNEILLMGDIYIKNANQSATGPEDPLRYYIYKKEDGPGIYEIRSSISNLSIESFTWDKSNFPGFYYDIDKNIGTEKISFRLSGDIPNWAKLDDRDGIVYTTQAQPVDFGFEPWGQYMFIGFLGEGYFAAYNLDSIPARWSTDKNLMTYEQLTKVLRDEDNPIVLTKGSSLKLEEGYEVTIKSVNTKGEKVYLELTKNGEVVDSAIVRPSMAEATIEDKTYYYRRHIGDAKSMVTIAVHFENISRISGKDVALVNGIFQISDDPIQIGIDQEYERMSIRAVDPSAMTIILNNKDNQITLTRNRDIILFDNFSLSTADSSVTPLRYYIYKLREVPS